jgi:hypothetical protein
VLRAVSRSRYGALVTKRKLMTATELEEMTPDQRAAVVNERIVTDLDELPPEFRAKVVASGQRLAAERATTTG